MSQLIGGAGDLGWVVAKAGLMFAVTVIGLRLGERRTLAQLGAFDFAVAVAIGSIIGRTVTASDTSFLTGAVALVTLLAAHRLVAVARRHSRIAQAVDHPPRVLVAGGAIREREVARAGLTTADVYALLRGQGVDDLGQVGYLLYETRGATTLVRAGADPGPLTRSALAEAGFADAVPAGGPNRDHSGGGEDHPGSREVVGDDEVAQETVADEAVVDDLLEHDVWVGLADPGRVGQADVAPQRGEVAGERVAGLVLPLRPAHALGREVDPRLGR